MGLGPERGKAVRPYYAYWGKADEAVGGYHLAAFHCLDVAAVAEVWLVRSGVLRRKFAQLLGMDESLIVSLVALLVALHDFGKFDVRFQLKAPDAAAALDPMRRGCTHGRYDHGWGGYDELHATLAGEVASRLGTDAMPLLQAVCGHHGALPSNKPVPGPSPHRFRAIDRAARRAWFDDVVELFEARGAQIPWVGAATMALVELLAGFCSVCDWVGSQTDYFPYEASPLALDAWYAKALPRAEAAIAAAGFLSAKPSGRSFTQIFSGFEPRDVQAVTEGLSLPEGPCVVVIEAQMGSGKTEAALSLAERWLERGDASGLFLALPTMATSNGMFGRIVQYAGAMFEGELNVRLAHSRSRSDETFRRLIERPLKLARGDTPDEREASLVCARWFLDRKRALLGQLGVGTVDQAMQAVITVRHNFVRAFGLATSVVVVDEVHAYDVYMEVILERLAEWLGALRTPLVLLSATLPAGRRHELVAAYRRGAGWPEGDAIGQPTEAPYPLVTVGRQAGVVSFTTDTPPSTVTLSIEHHATGDPCRDLLPRLVEAARQGAMVGYVRNTVTDAQAAFDVAAASGLDVRLFHARLRAKDRAAIERDVIAQFGPQGERRGALLIATQVVEQSLDLDFDLLATDLAPVDLVLQRAGRLHRHRRERPPGFSSPTLVLVTPPSDELAALRFGGSGYVYDEATLWLAAEALAGRTTLRLPDDIRSLVEPSYEPVARAARLAAAPNAERLLAAEARLTEKRAKRELAARRCCIPPASFDPGSLAVCDDDEEEVRALTRDGESATLLLVRWEEGEGYSLEAGGEPWGLDAEAPWAWKMAQKLFDETINVPAYPWEQIERGARARGSAREWEDWSRRFEAFAAEMRLGHVVVVPVRERNGIFRGRVETNRQQKALAYTTARGLWFPKEEA